MALPIDVVMSAFGASMLADSATQVDDASRLMRLVLTRKQRVDKFCPRYESMRGMLAKHLWKMLSSIVEPFVPDFTYQSSTMRQATFACVSVKSSSVIPNSRTSCIP